MALADERSAIEIDLSGITSESELVAALAAALQLTLAAPGRWDDFVRGLTKSRPGPGGLVLRALQELERKFPEGARAMMDSFAEYNNLNRDAALTVEVGEDYNASVYFLQFLAERVKRRSKHRERAYVSCWVKRDTAEKAEAAAKMAIEGSGWQIVSLDDCHGVVRSDYEGDSADLEFFRQALIDGEVCVFDSWQDE
jgi:hypothetical protein